MNLSTHPHSVILAVAPDLAEMAHSSLPGRGALGSLAIVLITALAVSFGFVVWAVFIRKPARRRERGTLQEPTPVEPGGESESHRRRRRRRQHRSRNPTLSETGGLPPERPGETPPPQP